MYLKRFLLVAIASVMSLGFLGACGGGTNDTQMEETPAGEMTEEESDEDGESSEGEGTETENDD